MKKGKNVLDTRFEEQVREGIREGSVGYKIEDYPWYNKLESEKLEVVGIVYGMYSDAKGVVAKYPDGKLIWIAVEEFTDYPFAFKGFKVEVGGWTADSNFLADFRDKNRKDIPFLLEKVEDKKITWQDATRLFGNIYYPSRLPIVDGADMHMPEHRIPLIIEWLKVVEPLPTHREYITGANNTYVGDFSIPKVRKILSELKEENKDRLDKILSDYNNRLKEVYNGGAKKKASHSEPTRSTRKKTSHNEHTKGTKKSGIVLLYKIVNNGKIVGAIVKNESKGETRYLEKEKFYKLKYDNVTITCKGSILPTEKGIKIPTIKYKDIEAKMKECR